MQSTAPFDAIAHNYDQQFTETAVVAAAVPQPLVTV